MSSHESDDWTVVHVAHSTLACIPPWMAWQRSLRKAVGLSSDIRAGINISIVLASAYFVEGNLEQLLLDRLSQPDVGHGTLDKRLWDDARSRVSRTTGVDNYDEMFALLVGERASKLVDDGVLWESVSMLFAFRNLIAHGRATEHSIIRFRDGGSTFEMESVNAYRKIEAFLLKKHLLASAQVNTLEPLRYFTDDIADHFWTTAEEFLAALRRKIALQTRLEG